MNRWMVEERCLELVQGDITDQDTDAIVNAANSRLAGGGGVDGAIHRRGGPQIMEETQQRFPQGCATGDAVVTGAGQLHCRHVIHTVGPIWQGGNRKEADHLRSAYQRCLQLAVENECHSIAFPSLSTGAYRFPIDQASEIALHTCMAAIQENRSPALVRFVLFDAPIRQVFSQTLTRLAKQE